MKHPIPNTQHPKSKERKGNEGRISRIKKQVFTRLNLANLGLAVLSAMLLAAIYPPVEMEYLAFVALVPWLVMVSRTTNRQQWIISYLGGMVFYLISVLWLVPITIPGYISTAVYMALFWPVTGFLIQRLQRRWSVPLFAAAPVVWVSFEFIRSLGPLGFSWFFLGHSQAVHPSLIQIADISGAYGVSLVLALVNGALAAAILSLRPGLFRPKLSGFTQVLIALLVLAGTVGYGYWRLNQNTQRPGPVLSVVQEDFPMYVDRDPTDMDDVFRAFLTRSQEAAENHPDLLIWPETCIGVPVNPEFLTAKFTDKYDLSEQHYARQVAGYLAEHAKLSNSYLIIGSLSRQINPRGHYPAVDKYNSAVIFDRQGKYQDRYDKIRLVMFGEAVPFRYTIPKLYWFLNENMTPYGKGGFEYSLTAGQEKNLKRFTLSTAAGNFRYAVAICYEDTMTDLIANFVRPVEGRKQIDFLVNISNDGWFDHSCELPQHFYICTFRAVENRIPVARAVNTGISGFITSDGKIDGRITDGSRIYGPGIRGTLTRQIMIDSRATVYSRIGNMPVAGLTGLVLLFGIVIPFFKKPGETQK
jgi:apolipoprotein N-acyltransferase